VAYVLGPGLPDMHHCIISACAQNLAIWMQRHAAVC